MIILALIILTTAIFLLAANGEESPNATPTESNSPPDFSLTDEEALARFEELNELATRAFVERDETLVPLVATSDSPLRQQAVEDIRQLERDGVFYRPRLFTMDVEVIENLAAEIVVRQVVRETPRFFDEDGAPVPGGSKTLLETIDWTLRDESGTWKIFDSEVVSSRVVRRDR
ncbi:MAG: hypothetical protein GEU71_15600 [Actinobacteria bacterium]|nr:hypothetical protein [Actinomycetota bacterium]